MNPAKLRAQAVALRKRAAMLLADAEFREKVADEYERLHPDTNSDTNRVRMETQPVKRRVGRPLVSEGPIAIASRNSGLTQSEIAEKLGENYGTVRTWNNRAAAPERIRIVLAKPPYSVPASAWKF